MDNFDNLVYTYKHRKIVMFLAKKYFDDQELLDRVYRHDMDKMYLLLFYEKKNINKFHNEMASHHDNNIPKTKLDYLEMILDWESARYTKDDKPLNAFDTLNKYYPHLKESVLPYLEKMGLAYSTLEKFEDVTEYAKTLTNITMEDIRKELINYINYCTKNKKYTYVK